MKVFKIIIGVLFLASAGLQLNDPDPVGWVLLYGLAAVVTLLSAFGRHFRLLTLLALAVVVIELVHSGPGFIDWFKAGLPSLMGEMTEAKPFVEETREFLGALVCFCVLVMIYIRARRDEVLQAG